MLSSAGDRIFVHGGRASLLLDDLFLLDLAAKEWTEITVAGFMPSARHGHTMWVSDDRLYLIGGDGDQLGLAYMYSMQLSPSQLGRYFLYRCWSCKLNSMFLSCPVVSCPVSCPKMCGLKQQHHTLFDA